MSNYGLHLIQNPSGTYSFVGSVPAKLAYVTKAGNMVTDCEVESQLLLPSNYRTIKCRSFQTETEAWNEAARLGYTKKELK
jgi:hypothetical protein